ncbi:hypothetical protein [Comamonas sp. JC664]|uniref:hypothetical protein n=1 Tax=Comamonas sp. JC664 TaxID=2801917 RepID=UPI00361E4AC4
MFNTGVVAVDNTTNFFDAASTSVDAVGNICVNTTSNVSTTVKNLPFVTAL